MNKGPLLKLTPDRHLLMTFALRQALEILQMNQLELGQWLYNEIEKNPLLEFDSHSSRKRFDFDLPAPVTFTEHIQNQIRENFSCPKQRLAAGILLEQLDEKGFLSNPVEKVDPKVFEKILPVLQSFDPPGIFARNLQESFLIQLKVKKKENSLAHQLVQECFDDIVKGRYAYIRKKLRAPDLSEALRDLSLLTFRPLSSYQREPISLIRPDLHIDKIEQGWTLELLEDELPKYHIQEKYLSLDPENKEEKDTLRTFKTQAKWLDRSLNRRRKMLREIGKFLLCKQAAYLSQKGPLILLKIREVAEKLKIHESTLSRALAGKYVSTPRGIIPLRSLISSAPETNSARELLERLVANENKLTPLTDDQLAFELKSKGFPVARRTISKYRSQLKIGSAKQRKQRIS